MRILGWKGPKTALKTIKQAKKPSARASDLNEAMRPWNGLFIECPVKFGENGLFRKTAVRRRCSVICERQRLGLPSSC